MLNFSIKLYCIVFINILWVCHHCYRVLCYDTLEKILIYYELLVESVTRCNNNNLHTGNLYQFITIFVRTIGPGYFLSHVTIWRPAKRHIHHLLLLFDIRQLYNWMFLEYKVGYTFTNFCFRILKTWQFRNKSLQIHKLLSQIMMIELFTLKAFNHWYRISNPIAFAI